MRRRYAFLGLVFGVALFAFFVPVLVPSALCKTVRGESYLEVQVSSGPERCRLPQGLISFTVIPTTLTDTG